MKGVTQMKQMSSSFEKHRCFIEDIVKRANNCT